MKPVALGGGLLEGRNISKVAYLDEAGMSSKEHEPYWVVAGVVVDLDKQWSDLNSELYVARAMLPDDMRDNFIFHAKELFNGGKHFPRKEWPMERRLPIINRLLGIPAKYGLPICWGMVEKAKFPVEPLLRQPTPMELTVGGYAMAFTHAAIQLEMWMREHASTEVAQITAEDRDSVRTAVRETIVALRQPGWATRQGINEVYFPFKKIIDAPSFQLKTEASLLQIADMCAYVISRWARGLPHGQEHFDKIKGNLITLGDNATRAAE